MDSATLTKSGWEQLSTNVWTRGGYTMLAQGDRVIVVSPIGKRAVRRVK